MLAAYGVHAGTYGRLYLFIHALSSSSSSHVRLMATESQNDMMQKSPYGELTVHPTASAAHPPCVTHVPAASSIARLRSVAGVLRPSIFLARPSPATLPPSLAPSPFPRLSSSASSPPGRILPQQLLRKQQL